MKTAEELENCNSISSLVTFLKEGHIDAKIRTTSGGRRFTVTGTEKKDDGVSMNDIVKKLESITPNDPSACQKEEFQSQLDEVMKRIKILDLDANCLLYDPANGSVTRAMTEVRQRIGNRSYDRSAQIEKIAAKANRSFHSVKINHDKGEEGAKNLIAYLNAKYNSGKTDNDAYKWLSLLVDIHAERTDVTHFRPIEELAERLIMDGKDRLIFESIIEVYSNFGSDERLEKACANALIGWGCARNLFSLRMDGHYYHNSEGEGQVKMDTVPKKETESALHPELVKKGKSILNDMTNVTGDLPLGQKDW